MKRFLFFMLLQVTFFTSLAINTKADSKMDKDFQNFGKNTDDFFHGKKTCEAKDRDKNGNCKEKPKKKDNSKKEDSSNKKS